jgi:hypothetical protein
MASVDLPHSLEKCKSAGGAAARTILERMLFEGRPGAAAEGVRRFNDKG